MRILHRQREDKEDYIMRDTKDVKIEKARVAFKKYMELKKRRTLTEQEYVVDKAAFEYR